MNKSIIEINDLSIIYKKTKTAVKHVSFKVPEKSVVVIVGESGSGKSTMVRSIIDLMTSGGEIVSGSILFENKDLTKCCKNEMTNIRGNQISMIFQDAGSYLNNKRKIGYQYIEAIRSHIKISKIDAQKMAVEMLEKMCLSDTKRILNSYPFELSGGMCQRVAIAMAMTMRPKLLLADEPTSALDVTIQAQVVKQMLELRKDFGTTVILVTHNMGVASYMADYIAVMKSGELVEWGTRNQIIESPHHNYTQKLLAAVPELEVC